MKEATATTAAASKSGCRRLVGRRAMVAIGDWRETVSVWCCEEAILMMIWYNLLEETYREAMEVSLVFFILFFSVFFFEFNVSRSFEGRLFDDDGRGDISVAFVRAEDCWFVIAR